MSGVRLEGLVEANGAAQVIHSIDLEVAEKDFAVHFGPTGCGTSATLRMNGGLEDIPFGPPIRKKGKEVIASSVQEISDIPGLPPHRGCRQADLSGGRRPRASMSRAIVRRPKMRAEIKRSHRRLGTTSIYVTHDQVEAMTPADRIVGMDDGRIATLLVPFSLDAPKRIFSLMNDQDYNADLCFTDVDENTFRVAMKKPANT